MAEKTNVFVIDDHPLVRDSLAMLINQQDDMHVCGEAEDMASALKGVVQAAPDVAIVDLSLKEGSGLDLIKHVKLKAPDVQMVVLSMHDEKLYAERCIRAGARGYVMKRESSKRIVAAIREVRNGGLFLSQQAASLFAERFVGARHGLTETPLENLSDRELQVFGMIGQGMPTRDIAALSKTIVDRFYDPASGRFFGTRGNPDSETPRGRHNDFGHSVKAFWMLYLGAQMNGDEKLRAFARDGMRRIVDTAYLPATGSWGSRMKPGGEVDAGKEWWIYAELDQALSTLAVEEGDSPERLEHTWRFWLDHMVDKRGGEVWGWIAPDGSAPAGGIKQHQWKNGFHSMEHAVVSYLAAQALNNKPARLYYAFENGMPEFTPSAYTMHGKPRKISTRTEGDVKVVEIEFDLPRSKQVKR